MHRSEAIMRLRSGLAELTDEDHSLCEVAGRLGLYCRGPSRWTFEELRARYHWFVRSRPDITREELEDLANRWQLANQAVRGTLVPCDAEEREPPERRVCPSWGSFSDADLARFWDELYHEEIEVVPDRPQTP